MLQTLVSDWAQQPGFLFHVDQAVLDFPSEEGPENSASETHDMTQRIMATCPT